MIEKNLILYLPFDDPDGSSVAYDYSESRADAELSGGAGFSRNAQKGKSLSLNEGEALTTKAIPFASDFTLSMFVMPASGRLGWLLNLPGIDNYLEQWLDVVPDKWVSLIFQKKESRFHVYQDFVEVFNEVVPETPVGFSINDDRLIAGTNALIDEVCLYDDAIALTEIIKEQNNVTDVEYYINGINFKDFGVYVSKSNGLIGQLERKEGATAEYDTYHGLARDLDYVRYKERNITLECFIEATSRSKFVEWLDRFYEQFRKKGTQRFRVEYNGSTKPLVYEVTQQQGSDPEKTWGRYNEGLMVGTFTLNLVEDDPVKMVLRHIAKAEQSETSFAVTTSKRLTVFWGDGTFTGKVRGDGVEVRHTYEKKGTYDIIIAGVVEEIENIKTDDIIVWQKLM